MNVCVRRGEARTPNMAVGEHAAEGRPALRRRSSAALGPQWRSSADAAASTPTGTLTSTLAAKGTQLFGSTLRVRVHP